MRVIQFKSVRATSRSDKVCIVRFCKIRILIFDLVPKRIGNTRREGRVRVDDDDDEPLLLDQTSLSKNTSQSQPQEEFPPSATLDPDKGMCNIGRSEMSVNRR